jgi:hypothetical protein
MLSTSQQAHLEKVVRSVNAELHLEAATLDAQQTLEMVLCRDLICFRPLRITAQEVNIMAALAGQAEAQQALQERLRSALHGSL